MSKLMTSIFAANAITKSAIPVIANGTTKYSTKKEATFEVKPFKLHILENGPPTTVTLTLEDALYLYEKITVLRKMEAAAAALYKAKVIRGFCHLYSGEEAVAVGIRSVMRNIDTITTAYRCHGWTYLMGGKVQGVLAELAGRKSGVSRGKGGSMHMYAKNFYGGNAIVGAQVPLGTGVGFAHKYLGDGGVTFPLYGDGAANQGQVFEAFNIAKLWNLPCAYVCENNEYAMGTSTVRAAASTEYYKRGNYIPGIWVDGMDVLATREAAKFALDYCSSGKGPIVMEMETYRYTGHSMSDPGTSYRSREEIAEVRNKRDPIMTFRERIISSGLVTADNLKEIDAKVKKEVDEAKQNAKSEAEVKPEELAGDIYYDWKPQIRGRLPNEILTHVKVAARK